MMIETVACRTVHDISYMVANVSIQCDDDRYAQYSLGLMLPALIVFVLIVPILCLRGLKNIAQSNDPQPKKSSKKDAKKKVQPYNQPQEDQLIDESKRKSSNFSQISSFYLHFFAENEENTMMMSSSARKSPKSNSYEYLRSKSFLKTQRDKE